MLKSLVSKIIPLSLGVAILSGALVLMAIAWTEPVQTPPSGNIVAPINTGTATQSKGGGLNVSGNLGIGTTSPAGKLDVQNGNVCIGGQCCSSWTDCITKYGKGVVRQIVPVNLPDNVGPYGVNINQQWTDVPGLGANITTGSSKLYISWNASVNCAGTANMASLRVVVDGQRVGPIMTGSYGYAQVPYPWGTPDIITITVDSMGGNAVANVAPGTHNVKLQWKYLYGGTQEYMNSAWGTGICYINPVGNDSWGNPTPYKQGSGMTIMEISN